MSKSELPASDCEAFNGPELKRWLTGGSTMVTAHSVSGAVLISIASGSVRLTVHTSADEAESLALAIGAAAARVREMMAPVADLEPVL